MENKGVGRFARRAKAGAGGNLSQQSASADGAPNASETPVEGNVPSLADRPSTGNSEGFPPSFTADRPNTGNSEGFSSFLNNFGMEGVDDNNFGADDNYNYLGMEGEDGGLGAYGALDDTVQGTWIIVVVLVFIKFSGAFIDSISFSFRRSQHNCTGSCCCQGSKRDQVPQK
jgi:hypothetical protein